MKPTELLKHLLGSHWISLMQIHEEQDRNGFSITGWIQDERFGGQYNFNYYSDHANPNLTHLDLVMKREKW
jgi:hypothetical protein